MRDAGRIAAAIEIVDAIETRHRPARNAVKEWGREHRFAGSGDRAWIGGLVLDALRHKASVGHAMGADSPRALVLGTLTRIWGWTAEDLASKFEGDEHAPEPVTPEEAEGFTRDITGAPAPVQGDFPAWAEASLKRVFGKNLVAEMQAFASRAPVDLRVNALKVQDGKAFAAVTSKIPTAQPGALSASCIRIPQSDPTGKNAPAESIPAYGKGWVEVQDEGSQIAGLAAGAQAGHQVLDFCAGAGGKTLELSAMTGNAGQVYAWDVDWKRLRAIWPRLQRAGARNVQVRDGDESTLSDLEGRMDVVFVDAPCTGSGTWRRRPDAKWRLSENQLAQRIEQQDEALDNAAKYVKPGGRMVYVTCSVFPEENADRIEAFLVRDPDFVQRSALDAVLASGGLVEGAEAVLLPCQDESGALQLSPLRSATDGFYIAVLERVG